MPRLWPPCRLHCLLQPPTTTTQVLAQDPAKAAAHYVLPMPKWEGRESALLKRLAVSTRHKRDSGAAVCHCAACANTCGCIVLSACVHHRLARATTPTRCRRRHPMLTSRWPRWARLPAAHCQQRSAARGPRRRRQRQPRPHPLLHLPPRQQLLRQQRRLQRCLLPRRLTLTCWVVTTSWRPAWVRPPACCHASAAPVCSFCAAG